MATIITKTIGQDGWQDYPTLTAAENDAYAAAGNTTDLVATDRALVYEIYSGVYSENVNFFSSFTTDATRNITYKAASGNEHNGVQGAGVVVRGNVEFRDNHTNIIGLGVSATSTPAMSIISDGTIIDSCIVQGPVRALQITAGSASVPVVVKNSILLGGTGHGLYLISNASTPVVAKAINNVISSDSDQAIRAQSPVGGLTVDLEITNNLIFGNAFLNKQEGATVTITGSDNICGNSGPIPVAQQADSQTWTFNTDTTAASTGSQVIYEDTNYSLVNVSGNDAVGVCDGTVAPATDINSEDRIRGKKVSDASYIYTFDAYADPGAFTTELVEIVKTIDAAGNGDYTTFDAAASAYPALSTSNNLSKRNESVVFEAKAGNYTTTNSNGVFLYEPTMTADSIRAVVFRAALGSEHNGDASAGVIVDVDPGTTSYYVFHINTNMGFYRLEGLNVRAKAGVSNCIGSNGALNVIADNCLLHTESVGARAIQVTKSAGKPGMPATAKNCIITGGRGVQLGQAGNDRWVNFKLVNNTITNSLNNNESAINIVAQATASVFNAEVQNNACLSPRAYRENLGGYATVTGTSNVGGATEAFPVALQAGSQTWTFSTSATAPSTGSQVIYDDTTYKLLNLSGNDAVGVGDGAVAPITDILGNARIRGAANEYADPGAFSTELITATRTIGKGGWQDFTTFTNAEAGANTIANELLGGSRLNLAERNGKIVYEAYAATYTDPLNIDSDLVSDPTRNITYKTAAGSEHGGTTGTGVIIDTGASNRPVNIPDDFAVVDGFNLVTTTTYCAFVEGAGVTLRNCIATAFNRGFTAYGGLENAPIVFENCVAQGGTGYAFLALGGGPASPNTHVRMVNCTGSSTGNDAFRSQATAAGTSTTAEYINCVGLSTYTHQEVGSFVTVTGSNNVGGTLNRWPEVTRAEGQVWTFTTSATAPSTGNQVIYTSATGALINVSGNDAVGVGTGTGAPTTDILGASRIRPSFGAEEVGPDYADPGAFSTELITITKTIGPNGDFSGFGQAESALFNDTSIIYERNLSKANLAVVVEVEAGRYTESLDTYNANFYGGPTNTVTYKAAAGSEHNGLVDSGVRLGLDAGAYSSAAANISLPFQILDGLVLLSNGTNYANAVVTAAATNRRAEGIKIKNCIFSCSETVDGYGARFDCNTSDRPRGTEEHPIVFDNCVFLKTGIQTVRIGNGADTNVQFNNCTYGEGRTTGRVAASVIDGGKTYKVSWTNCIKLDDGADVSYAPGSNTTLVAGPSNLSLHTGLSDGHWPESLTYTATTDTSVASTGNRMIYDASTLALVNVSGNDAIGVGTGSAINVPATDILGNSRIRGASNEYADPGAFSVDKITYTSSIGLGGAASGFDYGNFTDAEAEVTIIPYAENLAQRNLAIVFEAEAGTYTEIGTIVTFSTLTTDKTSNVTYRPVDGAEHAGSESAGVIVQTSTDYTPFDPRDNFTVLDGLVIKGTAAGANAVQTGSGTSVGVLIQNCILVAGAYPITLYGGGTASNPIRVESCVAKGLNTAPVARLLGLQKALFAEITNCTLLGGSVGFETYSHSYDTTVGLVNNLRLVGGSLGQLTGAGALVITGSNNVGGSSSPFPSLLQAESQTWTFTTDTTASSTGDQVIYTSATGELVNVSGNDAVGVGTGTGVPTTDILGNSRIRGANNEYTDPGAFSTEKVTFTKKIGPYREYTTFTDAVADVVAISTNGNLAERNEAIVFEADAGDYNENANIFVASLTSDATRNVTFKAAAGSEHGGQFESGVNITGYVYFQTSFAVLDGISVSPSSGLAILVTGDVEGVVLRNLMAYAPNNNVVKLAVGGSESFPCVVENCVVKTDSTSYRPLEIRSQGAGVDSHWSVVNNTIIAGVNRQGFIVGISSSDNLYLELTNNIIIGDQSYYAAAGPTVILTGSSNVGPDGSYPFPAALQAEGQTWTTTTNTTAAPTGNQVVYEAATGKMLAVSGNDAIGIGTLSAAPTTDINGTSRLRGVGTQYVDPGAFTSDVNTITKTIGIGGAASGFDFGSFLQAEAAVDTTAVTYNSNLAEKNIAIVFEADAGTYIEDVVFSNGLSLDPIRNVTYKAGASSEHGGSLSEGVIIAGSTYIYTSFMVLNGLVLRDPISGTHIAAPTSVGITYRNCLAENPGSNLVFNADGTGSALYPTTYENCVGHGTAGVPGQRVWQIATYGGSIYAKFINCTAVSNQQWMFFVGGTTENSFECEFQNNIFLSDGTDGVFAGNYTDPTRKYTGGGNVGTALSPFPSALQAESQTWTFTTSATAPSTGNQVIYTSATGALVNVSGNDAIGVGTGSAINVPANDILGKSRLRGLSNEYVDPGAFTTDIETTTLTANPGTLSAIIANLTPYITTTNIAKRNESILIELEKADYPEITFRNLENIIGDSVRNITIKPEEGAHHKGIRGAGIRLISATAGYDNIFFVDVSGLTLEGVEIYKPSGDIGRHGIVVRDSEGVRFKDVIFNDLEVSSHTQTMMGSTYRNGFLSPISFKNCLGFCRSLNFYFQSAGPLPGGKYELINCTLSSVSNTVPVIKADSTQADGTIEINLVNNLILSPHRNININKTNGGDGFVYGRNNFGPDTPNYQLPTAVRGSIYPIFPTFDYTPVPSSPAAVYRPGTFQLLDIPDNDVLQLGVGTDDPLVPLQGIGEDSRSTSSCNPGCWEDDYELVDLRINTFDGSTGIVDPYFGPPTDIANAVLPDATVPVFIVIGDSTAQGFSVEINDARSYREATDYWPTNAFDGSAYGYFWNKYMTTPDNGVTWTRDISYISPDTSGDAFLPINPRMGGIGVGTFTYSDPLPVSTVPAGNCSPLWDFSLAISGIFRNSAGETLTPHFIFLASTGSRLGSNGPTFLGNDEYNFSPSGYLFNTLNQSYIKPAVDHLMNNGKHPLLVGTLIMAGGTEANISYNPTPDGSKVSTSGAATYVNFLSATEAAAKVSGRAPWIAYEVWDSGSSDYPEVYSKLMQKALYGLKDISINRRINVQNLERDKGTTAQNTDIHFVQYKYPDYGKQFAGAYRALLTWRRSPIFGRTLSEIFNE